MSFLREAELSEQSFAPYATLRQTFGFVPNLFRVQSLRPDFIQAEVPLVLAVLRQDGALSRQQKESIVLVCSAAKLNTYCVTVHCEMLRAMGVSGPELEQLAVDHHFADISEADKALLDFALKLTERSSRVQGDDIQTLRGHGFTDEQILEAVVVTSLSCFFNMIAQGLGAKPDLEPRRLFPAAL